MAVWNCATHLWERVVIAGLFVCVLVCSYCWLVCLPVYMHSSILSSFSLSLPSISFSGFHSCRSSGKNIFIIDDGLWWVFPHRSLCVAGGCMCLWVGVGRCVCGRDGHQGVQACIVNDRFFFPVCVYSSFLIYVPPFCTKLVETEYISSHTLLVLK